MPNLTSLHNFNAVMLAQQNIIILDPPLCIFTVFHLLSMYLLLLNESYSMTIYIIWCIISLYVRIWNNILYVCIWWGAKRKGVYSRKNPNKNSPKRPVSVRPLLLYISHLISSCTSNLLWVGNLSPFWWNKMRRMLLISVNFPHSPMLLLYTAVLAKLS